MADSLTAEKGPNTSWAGPGRSRSSSLRTTMVCIIGKISVRR
ncbi:hypothetical protein [Nocardia nova]|nr:hypothetical protein [Nocardia nova]